MPTVLIVEDSDDMRELLKSYLSRSGYQVEVAKNGLDGIKLAQAIKPAAIILDLMMPLAAGDMTLGFLRSTKELKETPVIVTSAHPKAKAISEQLGANYCLEKPFELNRIREALAELGVRP